MRMTRPKITVKKLGGNDMYSWAVLIDGRPAFTGLSRAEVPHYKKIATEGKRDAVVAHAEKLGYYR
jgi:hypothetical protein